MFAKLREVLADPHLADYERWDGVLSLIDAWKYTEERAQAIAYADAHLDIPDHVREMRTPDPKASHWPLVRKINSYPEPLSKLGDDVDCSHITILYTNHHDCVDGDVSYINRFTGLRELRFAGCDNLQPLDSLANIESLRHLKLMRGGMRDYSPFPPVCASIPQLRQLRSLSLDGYFTKGATTWLSEMTELESLALDVGQDWRGQLGFLSSLSQLKSLSIGCFQASDELDNLVSHAPAGLVSLTLRDCLGVDSLAGLEKFSQLTSLVLRYCAKLRDLAGLEMLTRLNTLHVGDAYALRDISALAGLSALQELQIRDASNLDSVGALSGLHNLEELDLMSCRRFKELSPLGSLVSLKSLSLSAHQIADLSNVSPLVSLEKLELEDCKKIQDLDALAPLACLDTLIMDDCKTLSSTEGLRPLQMLETLELKGCKALTNIQPISDLTGIRSLSLHYSRSIKDVSPLCSLPHLDNLDLRGCSGIKKSLRGQHYGAEAITAWRSKVMPKSALPRKKAPKPLLDSSLLPGVPQQAPVDEDSFVLADYKAPTKKKEAEALAVFGNRVLPLLVRVSKQKAGAAAAAIRGLGDIATPEAYEVLLGYKDEKRKEPTRELVRAACRFPDPAAVSEALIAHRAPKKLDASGLGLSDLQVLAPLTSLRELELSNNALVSDLSPLSSLVALRELHIASCSGIVDLSPLSSLQALEYLEMCWVPVVDVSPLEGLSSLVKLRMHGLQDVRDLTPLSGLGLRELYVSITPVESLAFLPTLKALEHLTLDWREETASLAGLAGLSALHHLRLNLVSNWRSGESLGLLTQLESLEIFGARGGSLAPEELHTLTSAIGKLVELKTLDISFWSSLVDVSALSPLTKLEELVLFDVRQLDTESIPVLPALKSFVLKNCHGAQNLDFLLKMPSLESVVISSCSTLNDVSALDRLQCLKQTVVRNCPGVEDVER